MKHKWNDIVVITDVKWRKSLSAIRAIGKNNYFIIAIGNSVFDMGLWSSYVDKRVIIPNLMKNQEKYKSKLITILDQCYKRWGKKPILFTMEDITLKFLIEHRSIINKCKCLIPDLESYNIANNKFGALQTAKELGIDIPYTKQFENLSDLLLFIQSNPKRNWVVKPEVGKGSFGVTYVTSKQDLDIIKKHWKQYGKLIVQDRIPLKGESICLAMIFSNNNKLSNYFVYKRLHTYPIRGGASTSRIGVSNNSLVQHRQPHYG